MNYATFASTWIQAVQPILDDAVSSKLCAGINVLIRQGGKEVAYMQAGYSDIEEKKPLRRDSIFRMWSMTKPITATAAMILVQRGQLDLMDPVEKFLPGFKDGKVETPDGEVPVYRAVRVMDLLGMTAGVQYPLFGIGKAGLGAGEIVGMAEGAIRAGGGIPTVELMNRLGQYPLAFQPGTQFSYSMCADVLAAVVEVVSGKRYSDFLQEELFRPLGMKDTDFWVPQEKQDRFVTPYSWQEGKLTPWSGLLFGVGEYSRRPDFEAGGAGLTSTVEDYARFTQMLLGGGELDGVRILTPATVKFLTTPQLTEKPFKTLFHNLEGYSYGKLMRVCVDPGQVAGITSLGEYGWDGAMGTYFANFPMEDMTMVCCQNVIGGDGGHVMRRIRNAVASVASKKE